MHKFHECQKGGIDAVMFPYPFYYFSCHDYTEQEEERIEKINNAFFNEMHIHVGGVAGDTGIEGVKLDFRNGLRLQIPAGDYHVRLSDAETGIILFDEDVSEVILASEEKYYIPWLVEIFFAGQKVFEHQFDTEGQHVHIMVVSRCLGDVLAILPGVALYAESHNVQISMDVGENLRDFVREAYPQFVLCQYVPEDVYAVFYLAAGLGDPHFMPINGQMMPLRAAVQQIMGLEQLPPRVPWQPHKPRCIKEPYVCIAVQASGVAKSWLWPGGWEEIVAYLKNLGYRVLCIDRDREQSEYGITVKIPAGAEDFTGNHPLAERADMLAYADFFIGLSSGLSWLAWMAGCPAVLIAGFTAPWYEFPESYRVMNPRVCHFCFHDEKIHYIDRACQRYEKDSEHYLECQRMIPPLMVKRAIVRCIREHGRR